MKKPRVIESVTNECQSLGRAHESSSARAEQLIACLEGEIAKRDEELAACRVAVENCEVFRARIVELEAKTSTAMGVGSGSGNLFVYGDHDSIKAAQKIVIEHDQLRAELAAIKAQEPVGEVVGWYRLDRPYEMTSYPSVCATWHKLGAPVAPLYAAAPAAPAADAGCVLEQAMYTLISIGYHENSGLVHELRQALAAHRAKGVV